MTGECEMCAFLTTGSNSDCKQHFIIVLTDHNLKWHNILYSILKGIKQIMCSFDVLMHKYGNNCPSDSVYMPVWKGNRGYCSNVECVNVNKWSDHCSQ